ncbi:MAG TPA: PAS domain S-box protein [Dongiaceae bacterium]|nr:PAS domain S-box protein [Dongiaceae bacterium]
MPHRRISSLSPGRIAVGYAAIAILWIAFSDMLVTHLGLPPIAMTIKGTVFAFVTAFLLYLTIRRLVQAIQLTSQELRQSEGHLAEAQKLSHVGSWYLDLLHNRLLWSDEVYRMFDMPLGTPLTYERFLAAVHPDDRDSVDQAWNKALHGAVYDIEHRILSGGEVRWVREMAKLEFNADGKAIRGIGTVQDITERRQTEDALRERAALLNLTHDTVFVMDVEGVIRYWNRGAEERYGYSAEQAVGNVVHDLLKTVFPAPLDDIKAELTRTGAWEGELLHTKKDGSQLLAASRWALQRDEQGAPVAILETNNDVTQRKRAEQALRHLNRELRAISNCNQTLLRATDEQTLLEGICRIVCDEVGYRPVWVGYVEHDEAKSVRPVAWAGADESYLSNARISWSEETERGRGPTGMAVRSGNTFCVQDFATDPRVAPWRELLLRGGFRSAIALPLKDENGSVFGCLTMHCDRPYAFTPEETRLLEELAGDLAFGIVSLRARGARKRAEETIRRQEQELRLILDISPQLIGEFGPQRERLYANRPTLDYLGVTLEEWRDISNPLRFFHPDDLERIKREAYASDVQHEFEARLRRWDGMYRWFLFRDDVLRDEQGCATRWYLAAMDIDDRKRAEEERRESAERFRAIADYTYDWENWVGVDGKLLWVNPAVERITGYAVAECMAMPDFPVPIVAEADREAFARQMREAVEGSSRNDFEFRVRRKDGVLAWVAASWQPIHDSQGARLGYRSSMRDIAQRKHAEEALRESETRFRAFVDHAGDALFVLDLELRTIVDVNRKACEGLGYTREELIGKKPHLFHVDSDQLEIESVTRRAMTGETVVDRHRHRRKDGSLFPVEVNTSSFYHGGRRFLLKVARDISDRVLAEKQRDKLRQVESDLAHIDRISMLGELAASLAHELKQPITATSLQAEASLQWLRRDPPNLQEAGRAVSRILDAAERADDIIDRLRSLYKKSPPKRERVNVTETIRQMIALLLEEAGRHAVSIRAEVPDELPEIMADRVQLQQVLMNLMLNAIESMQETGGVLTVKAQTGEDGTVNISVSDTGMGLPAGKVDLIFNAFFTTKAQGSGMGLSISRSIVESHGGRIWATNNDGRGATFHFVLPTSDEAHASGDASLSSVSTDSGPVN